MFIRFDNLFDIGDEVELTMQLQNVEGIFTIGHRLSIVSVNNDGTYDLVDDCGNYIANVKPFNFKRISKSKPDKYGFANWE